MSVNTTINTESLKMEPGDILTFGSLDLLLTLNLSQNIIDEFKIKWNNLSSLENLEFLLKNNKIWKQIELSSTNDTIQLLLQINKSTTKLIKIGYVILNNLNFSDKQNDFKEFVKTVTNDNGLFLTFCSVCNCSVIIKLKLIFNNKKKIFVLASGKNENSKNNSDDENPFKNINNDIVNPRDFYFIYFNYNDYVSGNLNNFIKISDLFLYVQNLKKTTNSKIILNMGKNDIEQNDEIKNLFTVVDIYIFYEQNKIYELLKKLKEKEDTIANEEEYFRHYYDAKMRREEKERAKRREEQLVKKYKMYLVQKTKEKSTSSFNSNKLYIKKKLSDLSSSTISRPENIYITQENCNFNNNNNIYNSINFVNENNNILTSNEEQNYRKFSPRNTKTKNTPYKLITRPNLSPIKTLKKQEMFIYFKYFIYDKDPLKKYNEKIAIFLDDFNKIFLTKYVRSQKTPLILDFDLQLYPKINTRNINEINEYKKLVKSRYDEYIIIFIGNLLNVLIDKGKKGIDEKILIMAYLKGMDTIKKIVELEKWNIPIPKNKSFFIKSENYNNIDKFISQTELLKKEKNFVLDCENKTNIKNYKPYNPLLDKNMLSYFSHDNNVNILRRNGLLEKDGQLVYNSIYKETLRKQPNIIKKKLINDEDLLKNIKEFKKKYNSIMGEEECFNNYKNPIKSEKRYLGGYKKKITGFSVYNKSFKAVILPPLNKHKKGKNSKNSSREKEEVIKSKFGENSSCRSESSSYGEN